MPSGSASSAMLDMPSAQHFGDTRNDSKGGSVDQISLRQIPPEDQPFLWEMLYQAIFTPPGSPRPGREIIQHPEIARYVRGWGGAGDFGLIALEGENQTPVGAAWVRLFGEQDKGYGFVDPQIPELTIAVLPEQRGKGTGELLLSNLLEIVLAQYQGVSLSVSPDNPAVRLYQRLGFVEVARTQTAITMVKYSPKSPRVGQ